MVHTYLSGAELGQYFFNKGNDMVIRMLDERLADNLLKPDQWPTNILNSNHLPLLHEIVEFSLYLENCTNGSAEIDSTLHRLLRSCSNIVEWLPKPKKGRSPKYTVNPWDLQALAKIIPAGLDLELDATCESPQLGENSNTSWQANLHDRFNGNRAGHPSDIEHNAALSFDGGEYGSSWTANLALGRILLAAYLLAVIQTIQGRATPMKSAQALPALASQAA